jgi:hypothetical protein
MLDDDAAVLTELPPADRWLELTRAAALLLLLIDAALGLLLKRAGPEKDFAVHGHGFLGICRVP